MLRVGLTGGLGSGKSTVALLFAAGGVIVLEADQIGRELMQPGQPVHDKILAHFASDPAAPPLAQQDGQLDRQALARYVFGSGKLRELSAIVHPAVISEQERRMQAIFETIPRAIVMIESALIFEAARDGTAPGLDRRFDKLILVAAPEAVKVDRYVARVRAGRAITPAETSSLQQDARRRIATQIPDAEKAPLCDFVIENAGDIAVTEMTVARILPELVRAEQILSQSGATASPTE